MKTPTARPSRLALLALALCLPLAGCASNDDGRTAPAARDMTLERNAPSDEPVTPAEGGGLGDRYRNWQNWKDTSEGPEATLVYITEMGTRGRRQPAALIFCSDPSMSHFRRKGSARFTVRRLYRREMAWLLQDLDTVGLSSLRWEPVADYDKDIGPGRGLHLYRDKKRGQVIKAELSFNDQRTFRQIEDRLIQLTMAR